MASIDDTSIEISCAEVERWLAEDPTAQLIDVRETEEYDAGRITGARHVALGQVTAAADSIDRGRRVVFHCRIGGRSTMAAQAFRAAGFDAYTMTGGLLQWADEGRPLAPEGGYVADH
jgi:rhodanese-related sulfurtransferase